MKKVRSENRKGTKKQAQQTEMARLMANRPTRIQRDKEGVNGPRKPNE